MSENVSSIRDAGGLNSLGRGSNIGYVLICELHEIFVGALLFRGCEHSMIKGAADIENLP